MTPDDALADLRARADANRAAQAKAYHKAERVYLGVPNPVLNDLTRDWRKTVDPQDRAALADALWQSNIYEARLAAAKLLTTARIRPDDSAAWDVIQSWVPEFDSWAIADHACMAGQRRLTQDPNRIETVELWTGSAHLWTKRAALVITLPWTKQNHPTQRDLEIRDRVLTWAAGYVTDTEWFIQKAIAWWIRELSKNDAERASAFFETYGARLKPFARREAGKYL